MEKSCWVKRFICLSLVILAIGLYPRQLVIAEDDIDDETESVRSVLARSGLKTDDEVVAREAEAINLDGLSAAEVKELRSRAQKYEFQAEVNRMMKLIINSLYRNKEIFLRELISNAADALDKIRLMSLTDPSVLSATDELSIRIKDFDYSSRSLIAWQQTLRKVKNLSAVDLLCEIPSSYAHKFQLVDKDNHVLHITDTGIGMTKDDLINNLGTIARSGTSEFVSKLLDSSTTTEQQQDLIGQFGVGFYSSYLVADKVVVTTKHNDDKQYIWESDSSSFSIVEDPRGPTLKRGSQVSLHLKEEAQSFASPGTIKDLIQKYSQFINFPIYFWDSKMVTEEEPESDLGEEKADTKVDAEEDGKIEEEKEEKKTKKVEKTVWDWEKLNDVKPVWMRKSSEISVEEYEKFYKSLTKDFEKPLAHVHFAAEGEVTFKSILYIPAKASHDALQNYGKGTDSIKLFVRRVFITDDFNDMMPNYLAFVRGMVDSDDLPLNVSRENLQQHKLLKVIKKKLVRKILDMLKKMEPEVFDEFWKEFSTNLKLGVMEDSTNKIRISKLLKFYSSNDPTKQTSLAEYVSRMKDKQDTIYYMAGNSHAEVESSPFVERLLSKGYEVLYLVEAVDEYAINAIPEFDGKRFHNVAKEGLKMEDSEKSKELLEELEKKFEPLTNWLTSTALKDLVEKVVVSQRLVKSPCALVASSYGWSGNMERLMKSQAHSKANDPTREFYINQKKIFEINVRHPVIKELLRRVESDENDPKAISTAKLLFETSTLRSGYVLKDTLGFAERIEQVLRQSLDVHLDEKVEDEPEIPDDVPEAGTETEEVLEDEEHSEL